MAIATTALSFGLGFIKISPGISAALSPATFKLAVTEALRPSAIATGYNLASAVGMSLSQAFQYGALAALANYAAYSAGYVTNTFFTGFASSDAPNKTVSRKEEPFRYHSLERKRYGLRNHLRDIIDVSRDAWSSLIDDISCMNNRARKALLLVAPGIAYALYDAETTPPENPLPIGTSFCIALGTTLGTFFSMFAYRFIKEYKQLPPLFFRIHEKEAHDLMRDIKSLEMIKFHKEAIQKLKIKKQSLEK
mgnify:CR=1 FL=1